MTLNTAPSTPSLPRLTLGAASPSIVDWANRLTSVLEILLAQITSQAGTYTVKNNTGANVVRTIDCNAPSLAVTTNVLATLLSDLQNKGVLKR